MFKIVDGREYFYQWDLDRQLAVEDSSITEVHFCNRTDECSLVVEVVDGLANVPNIILQKSFDVRVFGYDGKATRYDEVFKVKPRTKPADYVYEETTTVVLSDILVRAGEAAEAASKAATEADIAVQAATEAAEDAHAAVETAQAVVSAVDEAVKTTQENAQASQTAVGEAKTYKEEAQGYAERAETAEANATQLKTDVEALCNNIPEAVQEAITANAELLDTVTIDVSACTTGAGTVIEITDDLRRFIQSALAGKDVIAFLKYGKEIFSTTTTVTDLPTQYILHLSGTPTYISGYETSYNYRFNIQIVYTKETANLKCVGFRYLVSEFATEQYVDDAIANLDIPEADVDLSDYYTKAETEEKIEEAVGAIDIPEVDLEDYYTKEEVDNAIEAIPKAEELYRLIKPDSEPTEDPMDGTMVQITDAHTIEYLNRVFNGEAILGYTWKVGLKNYLITDFAKAATGRLTLRAHRLFGATIDHYTFYIDKKDDGNWYWVGYRFEEYNIQKATQDAIQTAFENVVTAEGGAY